MTLKLGISAIRARAFNEKAISELREALSDGSVNLRTAVEALIQSLAYADLQLAMSSLEWLIELDSSLALLLMAGLYGVADDTSEHDICDAIELWLEKCGAQTLVAPIELHARRGSIAPRKALEWTEALRQSSGKP